MTKNVSRRLQINFFHYWIMRFDLVFCNETAIVGSDCLPSGLNEEHPTWHPQPSPAPTNKKIIFGKAFQSCFRQNSQISAFYLALSNLPLFSSMQQKVLGKGATANRAPSTIKHDWRRKIETNWPQKIKRKWRRTKHYAKEVVKK